MSLTAEQLAHWQHAVHVFGQLTDYPQDQRAGVLSQLTLSDAVRQHVHSMLKASQTDSTLDSAINLWTLPDDLPDLSGQRLGTWRLTHELGRGGMAVVYQAEREDAPFSQSAAVKLLPRGSAGQEHFQREQQALAQLEHPNIARLLDGGVDDDGTPWLAMECIDGVRIDDHCRSLTVRQSVQCLIQVADAVAHAHRHLIIHRDLKPGNILVDAQGRARLLDFGIAHLLSDQNRHASTRIMTPEYAAPEQHQGGAISTATDVFGLGGVLHKLLTGEPPQRSDRTRSVALRELAIDRDLKAIVNKALRDEPDLRYQSADALANDLRRWLDSRPVEAAIGHWRYRLGKWATRHRYAVAAAAVAILSLLAGLASTWWQSRQVQQQSRLVATQNDFLTDLLASPQSVARGRQVLVAEILDEAVLTLDQRFAEPSEVRASLFWTLARTYKQLDLPEQAMPLAQQALDDLIELGLMHDERFVRMLMFQSGAMMAAHQHPQAGPVLARAIELAQAILPEDDGLHGLLAMRKWLVDSRNQSSTDPEPLERILIQADALNWKDADRGTFECGLLQAMRQSGQMTATIERAEASLAWATSALGERHSNVLCITMELGIALGTTGQLERAVSVTEQAVNIASDWLGPRDRTVFQLKHTLASLIQEQGQLDEALEAFEQLIADQDRYVGLIDSDRLLATQGLVVTQIEMGQYSQAEPGLRSLIDGLRADGGDRNPALLINQINLAELLILDNRPEQALPIARAAHSSVVELFGPTHPFTRVAQARIGGALTGMGRHDEAILQLEGLDKPLSDAFSEDDINVMLTRLWHAQALIGAGRTSEIGPWLTEASDWILVHKGADHPVSIQAAELLDRVQASARE